MGYLLVEYIPRYPNMVSDWANVLGVVGSNLPAEVCFYDEICACGDL